MHSMEFKVKVLSGYRITIPKEIRERFNIKVGDELKLVVRGNTLNIVLSEEDPVMMLAGMAEGAEIVEGDELFLKEVEDKMRRSK